MRLCIQLCGRQLHVLIYRSDVAHESVASLQEIEEYKEWMTPAAVPSNEDAGDVALRDALMAQSASASASMAVPSKPKPTTRSRSPRTVCMSRNIRAGLQSHTMSVVVNRSDTFDSMPFVPRHCESGMPAVLKHVRFKIRCRAFSSGNDSRWSCVQTPSQSVAGGITANSFQNTCSGAVDIDWLLVHAFTRGVLVRSA